MAQEGQTTFSKLKLRRSRDGHERRIPSGLASMSIHPPGSESNTSLVSATPPPTTHTNQHELFRSLPGDDPNRSDQDLSRRLLSGENIDADIEDSTAEEGESTTSDDFLGPQHGRKASITFARETTTSDGDRLELGSLAIPHSAPLGISHGSHTEDSHWEHGTHMQDHVLENVNINRRKALDLHIDSKSPERKDSGIEQGSDGEASQTSPAILSPASIDELIAPMQGVLSPISASVETTKRLLPFSPSQRTDSQRSRSYQRLDRAAGVSATRRRSTRSANSSASPASAFLAQWNRPTQMVQEVEPDDEGQEIGDSGWIIGRKIGYGGFSSVKEVSTINPETGKKVVRAVKVLRKRPIGVRDEGQNERMQAEFEHEVALWRYLKHRHIVPLIVVYDTPFAMFCITKLNLGGTLHDLMRSRRQQYNQDDRGLDAARAKRYAYQLAAAIRYLHEDMRIVHRDIKLENCLLDMTAPDSASQGGNILLCDFGMADYIQNDQRSPDGPEAHNIGPAASSSNLHAIPADLNNRDTSLTITGSLEYAAPELVTATTTLFSPATDIWAFGVVLHVLITGSLPFTHTMRETLAVMIEKSHWDNTRLYTAPAVRNGGPAGLAAVDMVLGCLTSEVYKRLDIGGVLEHRWFLNCEELYGDGCLGEDEVTEWCT